MQLSSNEWRRRNGLCGLGLLTPGPFDEWGAIAYSGVAQLAYAAGCNWDPGQEGPTGGNTFGCVKKEPGTSNAIVRSPCSISPGEQDYLTYCAEFHEWFSGDRRCPGIP